jgi:predicted phosphodiesterase
MLAAHHCPASVWWCVTEKKGLVMRKRIHWIPLATFAVVVGPWLTAGADASVVTLQPGPEGKDSTVWYDSAFSAHADWNFGVADYMSVQADPYHNVRRHGFLQFDLSGVSVVPEYLTSASLSLLSSTYYLNADTGANVGIGLYRVTEDWNEGRGTGWNDPGQEGEITWNNQPSFDPTPVATINVPNSQDAGNAGFVNLVKDWLSGSTPNYGLMVRLTEPDNVTHRPYHKYRSSDYVDDPLHRPKLGLSVPDGVVREPYLHNATQSSVDVMWGSSDATGTLHWGTSPGNYTHTVASTTITDTAGNYVHTAQIDGLGPNQTAYYYVDAVSQIIGRNDASYHATTAPSGNAAFRFAAYGDSRMASDASGDPDPSNWRHAEVINKMVKHDPRLVVHVGDMVMLGHLSEYNDEYFTPAAPLIRNTPAYTAIGNHELVVDPLPQNYRDVYGLPVNSVDGTEDYYSFDYGCIHFVSLDTEILPCGYTSHVDPVRAAQMNAWLEADLAANDKPWTVVFYHRPINFVWDWHNVFEQYGVDLVIQGHTHIYECRLWNGVYYITTGGGGAQIGGGPSGGGTHLEFFRDWHFCMIDASVYGLDVEVFGINGDNDLRHAFYIDSSVAVILGDANKDGIVNEEDASIMAAHWQQTGMDWEHGDFNDDGVVDEDDASIMASHWQETAEWAHASVPEPSSVVLLLGGMVSLLLVARRRGCRIPA